MGNEKDIENKFTTEEPINEEINRISQMGTVAKRLYLLRVEKSIKKQIIYTKLCDLIGPSCQVIVYIDERNAVIKQNQFQASANSTFTAYRIVFAGKGYSRIYSTIEEALLALIGMKYLGADKGEKYQEFAWAMLKGME